MIQLLAQRVGLIATRTPSAATRHSRVYMHRSYLEVSTPETSAASPRGSVPLFFLRFEDLEQTRRELTARGIAFDATPYQGRDGVWDNVVLTAPEGVLAPILVKRTHPLEIAREWPPAASAPQPCGARHLSGVLLPVAAGRRQAAIDFFHLLLPQAQVLPASREPVWGSTRTDVVWPGGRIALLESAASSPAATPGALGVLLAVDDLGRTRAFFDTRGVRTLPGGSGAKELWLDPEETLGIALGLAEG